MVSYITSCQYPQSSPENQWSEGLIYENLFKEKSNNLESAIDIPIGGLYYYLYL